MFSSLAKVKYVVAIASGKGGVGKSTVTANLAFALQASGYRIGVLDADIYGPSQALMLGNLERPQSLDGKTVEPLESQGVRFMSIAALMPEQQSPAIWRGPMVSGALQQLIRDTQWGELDLLLVDMPPGTGDIALTMVQKVPLSGAVIVTTPQEIALLDARKAIEMFRKVDVPVLGVIENMSTHICSHCGHEEAIFGEAGGDKLAAAYQTALLGRVPLLKSIREAADEGRSLGLPVYRDIAASLSALCVNKGTRVELFPEVNVDKI